MTAETKSKLLSFWQGVRDWAFKYIGGLFMDEKDGRKIISIGRCLLIFVVFWMAYFWSTWAAVMTLTPEMIAAAIVAQLPEGSQVSGVDVLAAAQKVVDAIPRSEPPLMALAFTTACLYVFGTKVKNVVDKRLNRG